MPGVSGVTVVTTLVCFFTLHARLRAHRAPGIPCALQIQGEELQGKLGRFAPREGGDLSSEDQAASALVLMQLTSNSSILTYFNR
jgi:hypothetical protein